MLRTPLGTGVALPVVPLIRSMFAALAVGVSQLAPNGMPRSQRHPAGLPVADSLSAAGLEAKPPFPLPCSQHELPGASIAAYLGNKAFPHLVLVVLHLVQQGILLLSTLLLRNQGEVECFPPFSRVLLCSWPSRAPFAALLVS